MTFHFVFDSFFHCKFYSYILDSAYQFLLFFDHLVLFALSLKYCAYLHLTDKVVQKGSLNWRMHAPDVHFHYLELATNLIF